MCVCVRVLVCVRARAHAPLGAGLCVQGQLFSSAACLPAPDCSSLQNRRPPGFQLWKRSRRRNSSMETPSLGASNSARGSRARSRVPRSLPPGRGALEGCEVPGFALLQPLHRSPPNGARSCARSRRAAVSGSRWAEAGASVRPQPRRRRRPSCTQRLFRSPSSQAGL